MKSTNHAFVYVCMYVVCIRMYVCVCVYIYIYIYIYTGMHISACACARVACLALFQANKCVHVRTCTSRLNLYTNAGCIFSVHGYAIAHGVKQETFGAAPFMCIICTWSCVHALKIHICAHI